MAIECDSRVVLAQALLRARRADEAAGVLATMQDWVQREAPLEQRHLYEQCRAWLAVESERYGEAIELWSQCAELARREGSMANIGIAFNYQGLAFGGQGRWAKAVEAFERERALMLEYRLLGGSFGLVDNNLAHAYLQAGRYADALAAIERAEATGTLEPSTQALRRAHLYLALGQPGRARGAAERALEHGRSAAMRHGPLLALARIQHAMGAVAAAGAPGAGGVPARDFIDEAERLSAEIQRVSARIRVLILRAECARGAVRVAFARQALAELAARELHGLRLVAQVRLSQGLLEAGDAAAARDAAETALTLAESYEPEFMHRAEVHLAAVRAFDACGDPRAHALLPRALDDLHRTAGTQVPAEFRQSFLERVAAHRELVTLGSRLALPQ
jgi:tetratricopeptide (TPR) repeat protein